MLPLQATNANALQTSKTTQVRESSPHCIKFAAKQVRHHKIRSLLKFVLPWVASDPKKMHPFRSHEIGRSLHRVDSGRCASFCNGISQRPPVQSLKLRSGALFLGGAMMLDQNFESQPFRRCSATLLAPLRTCPVDKFVRYGDDDLSLWMHLSTYQLQPRHHHHLPMPPVWPPWWIQKPPVDGHPERCKGKYLQKKNMMRKGKSEEKKKEKEKKKMWTLKGGE